MEFGTGVRKVRPNQGQSGRKGGYNAGVTEADRETRRNVMVAGAQVRHGTLMQLVRNCIYPT